MQPLLPPFSVTASYQTSQYATGTYVQGGSQVFSHLVAPPTSGVASEVSADAIAHAKGFSAYSAANAVQTITITGTPTGGTFTLEWGDGVTTPLAYNATATQVQTALRGLATASTGGVSEIQRVAISGAPTGGTFTLTYSGQTTGAIAYNAPSTAVASALAGLSNVGNGNVTVSGGAGGPYTITFAGALGFTDVAQMTATASLTGGTTPGVTVTTQTAGVAQTPNITVSGSNGGPFTVTFTNVLGDEPIAEIGVNDSGLTGGTNPAVNVVVVTPGRGAFVNNALLDGHRHNDWMRNLADSQGGNHF